MNVKTIALLHPGNMGATIGDAARQAARKCLGVKRAESRYRQTGRQRGAKGLVNCQRRRQTKPSGFIRLPAPRGGRCCQEVAAMNFPRIYVDAKRGNLAPRPKKSAVLSANPAQVFVDGGIIGSPVKQAGTTGCIFPVSALKSRTAFLPRPCSMREAIGNQPGAASALKMPTLRGQNLPTSGPGDSRIRRPMKASKRPFSMKWSVSQPALRRNVTGPRR